MPPAKPAADLDVLIAAVRDAAAPPLLLDPRASWSFLGLSKSAFYRLTGTDGFPRPVQVPGTGPRWRRTDLEKWAGKLRPRRRQPTEVAT